MVGGEIGEADEIVPLHLARGGAIVSIVLVRDRSSSTCWTPAFARGGRSFLVMAVVLDALLSRSSVVRG
jgi:hypothetical protein